MWVVDTSRAGVVLKQDGPRAARLGSGCLCAWVWSGDIYCARADLLGRLLDNERQPVCVLAGDQGEPHVAAGLDGYLVVWVDRRAGKYDIYAARVAADGTVLEPNGFPVCATVNNHRYPRVAAGDSCWLVVWTDERTGTNVFGARVGFDGTVLDPGGLPIGLGTGTQTLPDVAWNGDCFLVVWKSDETGSWVTRGARVTPDGAILDPAGFDIAGDRRLGHAAGHPGVASDGSGFTVVWQNETAPRNVFASRVAGTGQTLGDPVLLLSSAATQQEPEVAFSQGKYLVVWQQSGSNWDVWATRLTTDGVVVDTYGIQLVGLAGEQGDATPMGVDYGWLVSWRNGDDGSAYAIGVDTSGTTTGEPTMLNPLTHLWAGQVEPELVRGRENYLLAWESRPAYATDADICGIRLDEAGRLLDTVAFAIARHPRAEYAPGMAYGDSTYLVVYRSYSRGLRASRVTEDGRGLDLYGIHLSDPGDAPQVAYGGGVFLVVWYWDTREDEIRAAREEEDGYVLDPGGFTVIAGTDTKRSPCVAFDGENFLVVWETDYYVKAARVRPSGTVIDPYGFYVTSYQSRQPDVAFDGENYLVTWTDRSSYQTYGTRITPGAQHLDTARVRVSWGGYEYDCRAPRVAFNGENYVVAWEDNWSRPGIKGTLVSPDLVLLDSFDMPPPTTWGAYAPAMACGPGGGFLVFSARTDPGMPWDTLARIWAAPLGLPPDAVGDSAMMQGVQDRFEVRPVMFRQSVQLLVPASVGNAGFRIYDAAGRCIRELGREAVAWDGKDASGRAVPAGVYLVELAGRAGDERRKVVKLE